VPGCQGARVVALSKPTPSFLSSNYYKEKVTFVCAHVHVITRFLPPPLPPLPPLAFRPSTTLCGAILLFFFSPVGLGVFFCVILFCVDFFCANFLPPLPFPCASSSPSSLSPPASPTSFPSSNSRVGRISLRETEGPFRFAFRGARGEDTNLRGELDDVSSSNTCSMRVGEGEKWASFCSVGYDGMV